MSDRDPNAPKDDNEELKIELRSMKKDLKKFMDKTNDLEKELRFYTAKCQAKDEKLKKYMDKTDGLEKSRNILYIGQLCAIVMEEIYLAVVPVYFKSGDYKQPHLKYIDEKIKELYQTGYEKGDAQDRWKNLQEKIDSDKNIVKKVIDFMEEMLAERNKEAHPFPLNKDELKNIARALTGQKQQLFEKVIKIWEMTPFVV